MSDIFTTKILKSFIFSKNVVTDTTIHVIVDHLKILLADLQERFSDLFKQIDFPTWMMQPMLVDLSDISNMQAVSRRICRTAK